MEKEEWFDEGTALVLGGTGAIGNQVSRLLAVRGSDVCLTYAGNHELALATVSAIEANGRSAVCYQLRLESNAGLRGFLDQILQRFGHIHSVIYAVGPDVALAAIGDVDPARFAAVLDADVNRFYEIIHAILPILRKQGSGSITAITTAAVGRVPPRDVLSAAPKAAVETIVKTLAREFGREGIRANCVAPGWINAGVGARMISGATATRRDSIAKSIPVGRIGESAEVAEAVVFLASKKAGFITGHMLPVDGGWQI